jgi:hypothetical protein
LFLGSDFYEYLRKGSFSSLHAHAPSSSSKKDVQIFLENASQIASDLLQLKCFNAGRSYRKMRKMMTSIYDLTLDSQSLGQITRNWSRRILFSYLRDYMEQGIVLDLYSVHEYPFVYWYYEWFLIESESAAASDESTQDPHVKDSNRKILTIKHRITRYFLVVREV